MSCSWYVIGDFNVVGALNEKKYINSYGRHKREIDGFNEFIEHNMFLEITCVGIKFT